MSAPSLDLTMSEVRLSRGGRLLLDIPALTLEAGTTLGIRGPSGAGKSTLLYLLAGLLRADAGQVRWGGVDLSALSPAALDHWRRRTVGLVFQDFNLIEELSAKANAELPALFHSASERQAIRARAASDLDTFGVAHLSGGIREASAGERQRVAIARALAPDPAIVLGDEPTANLDTATARDVMDAFLARLHGTGRTLILASHDETLLARMDRCIALRDGRLEAEI
ncbi:MAG: ABC transporter ATP-binding protein [Shimia sp.]